MSIHADPAERASGLHAARLPLSPAPRRREGGHVTEAQRRRLLSAMRELIEEDGVRAANITIVSRRAGVSRKTFYDIFTDLDRCLLALFEEAVGRIERALHEQGSHDDWRERVRTGLTVILACLDREPIVARFLIVEALSAGEPIVAARAEALRRLIAIVEEGRTQSRRQPPPLTAEGIVGAVFSVVQARLLAHDPRPLGELAGPLMAMIVQPYFGPVAAQGEIDSPPAIPQIKTASRQAPVPDPFKDLPMRLTYRTARVLSSIGRSPGSSSRQVADAAGVTDQGQMSRLLTRLQRLELVQSTGGKAASGEAKAWTLTDRGHGILQAIGEA